MSAFPIGKNVRVGASLCAQNAASKARSLDICDCLGDLLYRRANVSLAGFGSMDAHESLGRLPWSVVAFVLILVLFLLFAWQRLPRHVKQPRDATRTPVASCMIPCSAGFLAKRI